MRISKELEVRKQEILVHTNLALNGVWVAILVSHIISAIVALIVM